MNSLQGRQCYCVHFFLLIYSRHSQNKTSQNWTEYTSKCPIIRLCHYQNLRENDVFDLFNVYIPFISRTRIFDFFEKWMLNALIHGVWRELAYSDLPITLAVMFGASKSPIPIYLPCFRIQGCCTAPLVRHFSLPAISPMAAGDLQAITPRKYSSSSWRDLCDTSVCLLVLSGRPHRS